MTKEEIKHAIAQHFHRLLDSDDIEYAGEIALYWYCVHNHTGQFSDLYSILCRSDYRPCILANDSEEIVDTVKLIYDYLTEKDFQ